MSLQIMKALLGPKNAKKGFIFLRLPESPIELPGQAGRSYGTVVKSLGALA
jgi:hypothetical protein